MVSRLYYSVLMMPEQPLTGGRVDIDSPLCALSLDHAGRHALDFGIRRGSTESSNSTTITRLGASIPREPYGLMMGARTVWMLSGYWHPSHLVAIPFLNFFDQARYDQL